ncbi:unnamed protein product [Soboliphyme baturini]|uniref:Uncharacterized protein n=1 Tax=Soboliphyme baturini TaxID=241478 RepID=A0A183ISZ6_9BILA|nr:unnamed protein product [Soboliphyme baturini]
MAWQLHTRTQSRPSIYGKIEQLIVTPRRVVNEFLASPQYYNTSFEEMGLRSTVSFVNDKIEEDYICLGSYHKYGFSLSDGTQLCGPVVLFPKIALSWRSECCQTFNFLNDDKRYFAALLYPPDKLQTTADEYISTSIDTMKINALDSDLLSDIGGTRTKKFSDFILSTMEKRRKQLDMEEEIKKLVEQKNDEKS